MTAAILLGNARTRARDIGIDISLWAKIHVRKLKKYPMDENAKIVPFEGIDVAAATLTVP